VGIHCAAHSCAYLGSPHTFPLRTKPDHPCLDHHTTRAEAACGVALPTSVPTLSGKRGEGLSAAATRVEPACASSFPATAGSLPSTYAAGIATRLTHRDLDLLEERLRPRIDTRSTVARPPRPDSKILALIPRHSDTIDIEMSLHKSC
jgi:hypothetical protein